MCMSLTVNPSPAVQECFFKIWSKCCSLHIANQGQLQLIGAPYTLDLEIQTWIVGDTEVIVLPDTGCNFAAILKDWCLETKCLTKSLS